MTKIARSHLSELAELGGFRTSVIFTAVTVWLEPSRNRTRTPYCSVELGGTALLSEFRFYFVLFFLTVRRNGAKYTTPRGVRRGVAHRRRRR